MKELDFKSFFTINLPIGRLQYFILNLINISIYVVCIFLVTFLSVLLDKANTIWYLILCVGFFNLILTVFGIFIFGNRILDIVSKKQNALIITGIYVILQCINHFNDSNFLTHLIIAIAGITLLCIPGKPHETSVPEAVNQAAETTDNENQTKE